LKQITQQELELLKIEMQLQTYFRGASWIVNGTRN